MNEKYITKAIEDSLKHSNALLKFISPNNVGDTGSHECGFYLPKPVWKAYTKYPPEKDVNYEEKIKIQWQNGLITKSKIKWYGVGTRSEYRLTTFGRNFPYLKSDWVGNLLILIRTGDVDFVAYVLEHDEDIEEIQAALGVEVINSWALYSPGKYEESENDCIQRKFKACINEISEFPSTNILSEIARNSIIQCISDFKQKIVDKQILTLIETEYLLFKEIEKKLYQHKVIKGFETIDSFLELASSIMNRRKSRAGRSLENHLEFIMKNAGIPFDMRPMVDGKEQPDILIPSRDAYEDSSYPSDKLFMVGVKRTCKDRWRQVLKEAKRIPHKHIFTIQPSISLSQLNKMHQSGISLIVPENMHSDYPADSQIELLSLNNFIKTIHSLHCN